MEWELDLHVYEPGLVVEELSILEYAREQGICIDYTTELPSPGAIYRELKNTVSLNNTIDQDPPDCFEDDFTNAIIASQELAKDRLTVNQEAAYLLKTVVTLREPSHDDVLTADARQTRDLKLDLPVLQTDAELDLLHFVTRDEPDFKTLRTQLVPEDIDEENDEGLGWPTKYSASPAQCDAKVKSEKLAMTRDALAFLQEAVEGDVSRQDEDLLMAEEMARTRAMVRRHVTPPLLPLSSPLTPYIPSSPANRLPLLPESSGSIAAEAEALEQQIMARDSLVRHHSGSSDSIFFDAFFDAREQATTSPHFSDHIPNISKCKRKANELKVEGPLTPEILPDSPMKRLKIVTFSNMIQVGHSLRPWSGDDNPSDFHSATGELNEAMSAITEKADRKLQNKKLSRADTKSRVDIPVLDFALPVAPWNEFSKCKDKIRRSDITELEAQMRFLQHVKRNDFKSATAWRGDVADHNLSWGWFSSPSSTIKLRESLYGQKECEKIQAELKAEPVATSADEVWKKDGLRVLDEEEDDEDDEVKGADFEERSDMDALIRKRKLEVQERDALLQEGRERRPAPAPSVKIWRERYGPPCQQAMPTQLRPQRILPASPALRLHQPTSLQSQGPKAEQLRNAPTELMFGGFSASTALHKFMETQGKVIKAAKPTVQQQCSASLTPQTTPKREGVPSAEPSSSFEQKTGVLVERFEERRPETPPTFILPPSSFIVSNSLLKRRPLVKQIEALHPKAELIYRDYNLPHSTAAEADMILSPSTGILLTTIQQIKQAPLPGQVARSLVKERMVALQERYERLIVLVSEGLRKDFGSARPDDARDKDTLRDLEVFAAKLGGEVVITFVRGGEAMLARGVVQYMTKYGLPQGAADMRDIKLFVMETTWEVFLRRTGINPFAAQVILASLKVPTIMPLSDLSITVREPYTLQKTVQVAGLPAFLLMERENRVKQFQAIMGGRRILDKVSAVLDQRWLSASNG